uniref:Nuclear matrix constituent protein 1-like protein n=1 Tax=Chenopodium quinoa TaxID=63459 RepID=A0A803KV77_CHEQI
MFTPQRKAPWTPSTSTPITEPRHLQTPSFNPSFTGKTTSFLDAPPPTNSLAAPESVEFDGCHMEDWRRFKEVGLLDESALERKDHQAMLGKISRLEKELFDYQYNMGLLLLEKKDLISKTEELGHEVSEAVEILKRERGAHLIAVSEAEKREENLKKALQVERRSLVDVPRQLLVQMENQCDQVKSVILIFIVCILQRALRDMNEELAKGKATSETTVADLNARMEELQILNLDVEKRSRSVDAKLAESDRKNSELNRKLQDLEVREDILQREQLSLTQERESHELHFRKQKEDMLEWEKKLQEGEQRLCESRRILNEREEKLHEIDISTKVKESNFEELQKKIDLANETLKKVENDVKNQSAELDMKEKKAEALKCKLEAKEKQLQEEEQRLNARENVELEELINEHKVMLNNKMHEFELEIKQKESALEEEIKNRKETLNQKESEINHLELKLAEAKSLEAEKKQVIAEKENLEILRKDIEILRINTREQELHIEEERKILEDAERERLEYLRLQSSLKQEIDNVRRQSELIEKEAADLKLEREKFEKDWEALDEKRSIVDNDLETLAERKANFEKFRNSEEERLKRERAENEERLRLESESIKLQIESFEATMKQEKSMLVEDAKNQEALMYQDFEQQKQDLYNDMQKRREEWEKVMEEKERALEETRVKDMSNLKLLKEDAENNKREMEIEWRRMEKEKEELELNKKQFEETRVEISKDIKALDDLSRKLKKQREQLVSERVLFGSIIEKIKCCKSCGDSAQAFLSGNMQLPTVEGSSHFPRPSHDDQKDAKDEHASIRDLNKAESPHLLGGQMSVLRKCASIFYNLSPKKGIQHSDNHDMEETSQSATYMQANEHVMREQISTDEVNVRAETSPVEELDPVVAKVYDALNISQSDVRDDNVENSQTVDEFDNGSEVQDISKPEKSGLKNGQGKKPGRKRGPGVRRTHSVKAVVEDAKAILKDSSVGKMEVKQNDSVAANVNEGKILHADMTHSTSARKRSRSQASKVTESEQDVEHSEGNADSVTTGGRRKRRQTVDSALPTPGQRRYNLRRHAVFHDKIIHMQTGSSQCPASSGKPDNDDVVSHKDAEQAEQNLDETPAQSLDVAAESDRRMHFVQVSTTRSVEFSSYTSNAAINVAENQGNAAKPAENVEEKITEITLLNEVNGTSENVEEDSRSMDSKGIHHFAGFKSFANVMMHLKARILLL